MFVTDYLPPEKRRPFAGGGADLRPDLLAARELLDRVGDEDGVVGQEPSLA